MKKQYFLIIDTETTQDQLVADFGAIVCDRKGRIVTQYACMVQGIYNNPEHPLFYTNDGSELWDKQFLGQRYARYNTMLNNGNRLLASVEQINEWLAEVNATYKPTLTAYNLAFDVDKMRNTGIDCDQFAEKFCLWYAAGTAFATTKAYRTMILENHWFNAPTKFGNMSFKTNAEVMARFCLNNHALPDEPHTALEDAKYYELPILARLLKSYTKQWLIEESQAYNWRAVQVKDWFKAA